MLNLSFITAPIANPETPVVVVGPADLHPKCLSGADRRVCSAEVFQPALTD